MSTSPTVAVITSSIGRASLLDTINCIKQQSYPCRHYIFVDGEKHHRAVKKMVKDHPEIVVTYLPVSTGATGMCNSIINAIAPFIATEDIICYVDDDNTVTPDHVETFVNAFLTNDIHYAYSLRYLHSAEDDFYIPDNLESLGFWTLGKEHVITVDFELKDKKYTSTVVQTSNRTALIDTNCYAFSRNLAQQLANTWMINGKHNDQNITQALLNSPNLTGFCTGKRTVNYTTLMKNFVQPPQIIYDNLSAKTKAEKRSVERQLFLSYMDFIEQITASNRPWETPTLFKNNQLIPVINQSNS